MPGETSKRFLPNPFSPNSRLFRTGDSAKWLPDGRLQFLGRLDDEVKIRGYRVSLTEVEAALESHRDVIEAGVRAIGTSGDTHLLAYVVCETKVFQRRSLREHLQRLLPSYMLPADYLFLRDRLPRTSNGKLDRSALCGDVRVFQPGPSRQEPNHGQSFEESIALVWKDVLGVASVDDEDNFLELGGHSLLAIDVVVRLYESFDIELPIDLLLSGENLREIARQANHLIEEQP